ncbi:MAG: hypothetical protein IPH89_06110 [Bacteroidetes bacterium]|nr:hypothetical protein [Bacteroidota bacterium]
MYGLVKTITSGAAGYAYLPGTTAAEDGIMILNSYIGSIGTGNIQKSHALTHEIGHYLNLNHTWGGTNNPGVDCSGDDNVSDTPKTEGWTSCNLTGATCTSTLDNVQNFMEYSYCSTMFTVGQNHVCTPLLLLVDWEGLAERYNYRLSQLSCYWIKHSCCIMPSRFLKQYKHQHYLCWR